MCEMLNLFVPVKRAAIGPAVRGLYVAEQGERQRDFERRFAADQGTFLVGHGGGMCLCGFDDWPALYAIARDLLDRNPAPYVALTHFWSGDTYTLAERTVDVDDPDAWNRLELGDLVIARGEPAERRRHRHVLRDLQRAVGTRVALTLRSGKTLIGTLASFDPASEVGEVDGQVVVAAQVYEVG